MDINKIKNAQMQRENPKAKPIVEEKENDAPEKKKKSKGLTIALAIAGAVLLVGAVVFGIWNSMESVDGPLGSTNAIYKPADMDGEKTIGQYSVRVYENIIIGKQPFVFENSVHNDAEICYSVMYKEEEIFNSGYIKPGDAVSWAGDNVDEQGKTYGCNIIVSARDLVTGETLNSCNLRQLIHIDNSLPRTTGNSAFIYSVTVDNYSKAQITNGYTTIDYDVAITANELHPAEEGAALKVGVPETVIVRGVNGEYEVKTNALQYKTRESQYIYMGGAVPVEGATGDNYKMVTEYYINVYDQEPNAEFNFG